MQLKAGLATRQGRLPIAVEGSPIVLDTLEVSGWELEGSLVLGFMSSCTYGEMHSREVLHMDTVTGLEVHRHSLVLL